MWGRGIKLTEIENKFGFLVVVKELCNIIERLIGNSAITLLSVIETVVYFVLIL